MKARRLGLMLMLMALNALAQTGTPRPAAAAPAKVPAQSPAPAQAPASAQTPAPAQAPVTSPAYGSGLSKFNESINNIRVLLAPAQETTFVSPFAGRVRNVTVSLGQSFTKGAVLISMDCDENAARLRMAEAELAAARETHDAKLRMQGLQQAGEVEVSLAASAADRASAQVNLYRAQLSQCSVVAPFAGRAVRIGVKPHQGVTQGQLMLEVVSDGPLKLRLNTPAKWVTWLKKGTAFDVRIDETGKTYKARVAAINGRIDAVSQTIELEAVMDDKAGDLLPGMSGEAMFNPPH